MNRTVGAEKRNSYFKYVIICNCTSNPFLLAAEKLGLTTSTVWAMNRPRSSFQ